jgi:Mrp family chromosome partitioning ATPase
VLVVAESGRTREASMRQAVEVLQQVNARILGVALNRMPIGGGKSQYYYHYYYSDKTGEAKPERKGWRRRGGRRRGEG